ncbi:MAG: carbon storage regulator [Fuerstiella sp.]
MLVLSRKQGESVQIDEVIQVTVVSVGRGRVKLGIVAPDHVRIMRQELVGRGPGVAETQQETWPQTVSEEAFAASP